MLIGLAGYAQSGKDTVGALLRDGYGYRTAAFADEMRAAALAIDPIIGWHYPIYDAEPLHYSDVVSIRGYEGAKADYPEVRRFLQRVGTEMGRNLFGEDFWVCRTFAGLDLSQDWVLTDVRFPNEAQAVIDHEGIVVRVVRPDCGPVNTHLSETSLEEWGWDYVLPNIGGLSRLTYEVQDLMRWAA